MKLIVTAVICLALFFDRSHGFQCHDCAFNDPACKLLEDCASPNMCYLEGCGKDKTTAPTSEDFKLGYTHCYTGDDRQLPGICQGKVFNNQFCIGCWCTGDKCNDRAKGCSCNSYVGDPIPTTKQPSVTPPGATSPTTGGEETASQPTPNMSSTTVTDKPATSGSMMNGGHPMLTSLAIGMAIFASHYFM